MIILKEIFTILCFLCIVSANKKAPLCLPGNFNFNDVTEMVVLVRWEKWDTLCPNPKGDGYILKICDKNNSCLIEEQTNNPSATAFYNVFNDDTKNIHHDANYTVKVAAFNKDENGTILVGRFREAFLTTPNGDSLKPQNISWSVNKKNNVLVAWKIPDYQEAEIASFIVTWKFQLNGQDAIGSTYLYMNDTTACVEEYCSVVLDPFPRGKDVVVSIVTIYYNFTRSEPLTSTIKPQPKAPPEILHPPVSANKTDGYFSFSFRNDSFSDFNGPVVQYWLILSDTNGTNVEEKKDWSFGKASTLPRLLADKSWNINMSTVPQQDSCVKCEETELSSWICLLQKDLDNIPNCKLQNNTEYGLIIRALTAPDLYLDSDVLTFRVKSNSASGKIMANIFIISIALATHFATKKY